MRFRDNKPISGLGGAGEVQQKRRFAMSMPSNPDAPTPSGTVTSEMIDFADAWQALAEPSHAAYAQDENHLREMVLMTGTLATRADCEYVAVQDGNWTASTTWLRRSDDTFAVPVAGAKIGIPSGITVTMNNNATTAYGTLRVDGKIAFVNDANTKLYIDTIVINHGGEWEQGTTVAPIPSTFTSEVEFTNGGAIDTSVDDLFLGRGLLGMGATPMAPSNGHIYICGAEKDHWGTCSTTLAAGSTSVVLDAAPTGWAIGDEIQIAATNRSGNLAGASTEWDVPQADNATITNISGATITFTPATTYAHTLRSETGFTDLKFHVVNFTRNIKYRSASGAPIMRRGHVMLMGQNLDIRWAQFDRLGRTVKNPYRTIGSSPIVTNPSFDATNDAARIAVEGSNVPWGSVTGNVNVRGRYNLHIHRTGVLDGQPFGEVVGCTATEAPGWAFAHHQGNCNFRKNAARQWQGAGFVAEIGSEAGIWEDNYAGEARNVSLDNDFPTTVNNPISVHAATEKDFGVYSANEAYQTGDLARFQSAFWFAGRVVQVRRNVASGCQSGFVWMSRSVVAGNTPNGKVTPEPRVFYGFEENIGSILSDRPIIGEFDQCIAYGMHTGMAVIKASSRQDHSLRTHLKRFLAWNVVAACHLEYTAHYTISDFRLLGDPSAGYPTNTARNYSTGFLAGQSVVGFLWEDNTIRGFKFAFTLNEGSLARAGEDGGNYIMNTTTSNIDSKFDRNDLTTLKPGLFAIKTSDDIINSETEFIPFEEPVWPTPSEDLSTSRPSLWLNGNVVTDFETRNRTFGTPATVYTGDHNGVVLEELNIELMLGKYGYYTYTHPTHGASNYLLIPDLISLKAQDVNGDILPRYLTIPVRLTGISLTEYTSQGALPQRYVDAIALGDSGIADPETPDPNAAAWVVYEDIFGTGNLYEGL